MHLQGKTLDLVMFSNKISDWIINYNIDLYSYILSNYETLRICLKFEKKIANK